MGYYKKRYYKKRYYRRKSNDDLLIYLFVFALLMGMSFIQKYFIYFAIGIMIAGLYILIRYIIDLDLRSTLKKPLLYYSGTNGKKWLEELKKNNDVNKIKMIESGLYGEQNLLHNL